MLNLDKWEYMTVDNKQSAPNEYGEQGWELVTVISPGPGYGLVYFYKRKLDGRKKRAKN